MAHAAGTRPPFACYVLQAPSNNYISSLYLFKIRISMRCRIDQVVALCLCDSRMGTTVPRGVEDIACDGSGFCVLVLGLTLMVNNSGGAASMTHW